MKTFLKFTRPSGGPREGKAGGEYSSNCKLPQGGHEKDSYADSIADHPRLTHILLSLRHGFSFAAVGASLRRPQPGAALLLAPPVFAPAFPWLPCCARRAAS